MNPVRFRSAIEDSPFAWKVEELTAAAKPAIRLHADRVAMDDLPLGASRMGGLPDLPPEMTWPLFEDRPIEFLAQINFREAAMVKRLPHLPDSGWMVIFHDIHEAMYGEDIWRGLFFDTDAAALRRLEPRDDAPRGYRLVDPDRPGDRPPVGSDFHPCAIRMEAWTCPPDEDAFLSAGIEGDGDAWQAWWQLRRRLYPPEHQPYHLLGGLPAPIQHDPRESPDWHLLLQIDSDRDGPGWVWGDGGRMYFLATKAGLAARDFSQIQASWDCY